MKKYFLFFTIMLMFHTGLRGQVAVGDSALPFALPDTLGNTVTYEDYRGQILLLNFFTSWCIPCQVEAPQLEDSIWTVYRDQGVTVLGVDYKEEVAPLSEFAGRHDLTYPFVRDTAGSLFLGYGFRGFPSNILIDRNGLVALVEEGYDIQEMKHAIDSLLSISAIDAFPGSPSAVPEQLTLLGAYPNPFNSQTRIKFSIKENNLLTLRIFDILGRQISEQQELFTAGEHAFPVTFNEKSSGFYFYTIEAGGQRLTGKFVLKK